MFWLVSTLGAGPAAAEDTWEATLDRVVPAVVSIQVTGTRDFDTEDASNSQGTGFVIDAERGLILTNRHMVHAGPVVAEALFSNHEEAELKAVYRDPVHDFGFYRFDPKELDDIVPVALPLYPEGAKVGVDVRVIGNDSGEKLSILDGTLARLDRNAPEYGDNTYNDFNTFYLQAASNTSGGSSGSPVIDRAGRVIALNAGGRTRAASSFYLPLQRVVRALDYVRKGEVPPRGTLQTVFLHTPFDELVVLGLDRDTSKEFRAAHPGAIGMLVVTEILPKGPADGALRTGDVLLKVDGEWIPDFVALERHLDDSVGKAVSVEVDRFGKRVTLPLTVGDLHAITPDTYLETGRAVLHTLSFQMARNHKLPVGGVYVAVSGYSLASAGIPEGAVIIRVDGEDTPDLDTFQAALEKKADQQLVRVGYYLVQDPRHAYETVMTMDRRWFATRRCTRDDREGTWPCVDAPPPPPPRPIAVPEQLPPHEVDDKVASKVARSLVLVEFDIPYPTAGVKDRNFVGVGTIVDTERGLVVVDRDTVPVALGDMRLTIADTVRVPGELVYLHPVHNFAVVHYDPKAIGDVPVEAVTFSEEPVEAGDPVWQVGLNRDHEMVAKATAVREVGALSIGMSTTPRFRDANVEGIVLDDVAPSLGGLLADKKGQCVGIWASFLDQGDEERRFFGVPASFLLPVIEPLRRGETPVYRWIGAEFRLVRLSDARDRGVSDDRLRALIQHDREQRLGLEVGRIMGGTPAEALRDADILVAVDGAPITRMSELEALHDRESVRLTVVRNGAEMEIELPLVELDGRGTDRVLSFAGMLVHDPHHEVAAQGGLDPTGAYIAWMWYGSPSARYGLRPTRRVVSVDDEPVEDLDEFIELVRGMEDRRAVRIRLVGLDGSEPVHTMKLDLKYWPTELLERVDGTWVRTPVLPTSASGG